MRMLAEQRRIEAPSRIVRDRPGSGGVRVRRELSYVAQQNVRLPLRYQPRLLPHDKVMVVTVAGVVSTLATPSPSTVL